MSQSPKNNSRASELGDLLTSGTTGFVVRKRTGISFIFHLFLLSCLIMLGVVLLVYYRSVVGCLLAVAVGLCFGIIADSMEKQKKVKIALEFMNALFSSAIGKNYRYSFIAKTTGEIIFYNRAFQSVFPAYVVQSTRTVSQLLELYNVPASDREKLHALITANAEGTITTTIRDSATVDAAPISFEIEPIERPTGFFLIRGK